MGDVFRGARSLHQRLGVLPTREILQQIPVGSFPTFHLNVAAPLARIERHQKWFMVAFQFIPGTSTVTPIAIGISHIGPWRFLVLDLVGIAVWTMTFPLLMRLPLTGDCTCMRFSGDEIDILNHDQRGLRQARSAGTRQCSPTASLCPILQKTSPPMTHYVAERTNCPLAN